jgi:hypothetical protein
MIALLMVALLGLADEGYQRVDERHGVTVFRRPGSKVIEFGAEGVIDAPPDKVRAVLLDYPHANRLVKNIAETRALGRASDSLDVYQRLSLPVIADRDYTLHVTWSQEGDALVHKFETRNPAGPPPVHGVVRVNVHEGQWVLRPIDGGKRTQATYRMRLDLGGSVPAWMGRGRAMSDVPGLFEGIRRETRSAAH